MASAVASGSPIPSTWTRYAAARPERRGVPTNTVLALGGHELFKPEDFDALFDVADALGVPADSLFTVIRHESHGDPTALNPEPAAGLIQLTAYAHLPGYETADKVRSIIFQTAHEQLHGVVTAYYARGGTRVQGMSPGELLLYNFTPAFVGRPESTVISSKGEPIYDHNHAAFDVEQKGTITVGDVYRAAERVTAEAQGRRVSRDGTVVSASRGASATQTMGVPSTSASSSAGATASPRVAPPMASRASAPAPTARSLPAALTAAPTQAAAPPKTFRAPPRAPTPAQGASPAPPSSYEPSGNTDPIAKLPPTSDWGPPSESAAAPHPEFTTSSTPTFDTPAPGSDGGHPEYTLSDTRGASPAADPATSDIGAASSQSSAAPSLVAAATDEGGSLLRGSGTSSSSLGAGSDGGSSDGGVAGAAAGALAALTSGGIPALSFAQQALPRGALLSGAADVLNALENTLPSSLGGAPIPRSQPSGDRDRAAASGSGVPGAAEGALPVLMSGGGPARPAPKPASKPRPPLAAPRPIPRPIPRPAMQRQLPVSAPFPPSMRGVPSARSPQTSATNPYVPWAQGQQPNLYAPTARGQQRVPSASVARSQPRNPYAPTSQAQQQDPYGRTASMPGAGSADGDAPVAVFVVQEGDTSVASGNSAAGAEAPDMSAAMAALLGGAMEGGASSDEGAAYGPGISPDDMARYFPPSGTSPDANTMPPAAPVVAPAPVASAASAAPSIAPPNPTVSSTASSPAASASVTASSPSATPSSGGGTPASATAASAPAPSKLTTGGPPAHRRAGNLASELSTGGPSTDVRGLLLAAAQNHLLDAVGWTWVTLPDEDLQVYVPNDAFRAVLDGTPHVRIGVSYADLRQICGLLGCVPATKAIVDAIYLAAAVHPKPVGLVNTAADSLKMNTVAFALKYHDQLEKQLQAKAVEAGLPSLGSDILLEPVGKWWILDPKLATSEYGSNAAVNYGWFQTSVNDPIQTPGGRHSDGHSDYSQVCRAVHRYGRRASTQEQVDLLDVYAEHWPSLAPFIDVFR